MSLNLPEDPLLVPGVRHFSTPNQNNWKKLCDQKQNIFESSFFSLSNALLVLNYWNLYLIENNLKENDLPPVLKAGSCVNF